MDAFLSPPPATGPLSAVAEAALLRVFERASWSFHVMDREGRVVHGNPRFLECIGAAAEDLPRLGFESFRHDLAPERARTWFLRLFDRPGDVSEMATWRRADGREVPVWMTVAGLRTAGGDRLFIWARDRSEERRATNRLMESAGLQRHLAEGIYHLSLARTQEEIFQALLDRAAAVLPGPRWFLSPAGVEAGFWAPEPGGWRLPGGDGPLGSGEPIFHSTLVREVCKHRRLRFIEDIQTAPGTVDPSLAEVLGLKSLLGVPLVFEGRVIGVLIAANFQDDPPMEAREPSFAILQSLAHIAALAVERIQAEDHLEEAVRLAQNLAAAVRELAGATDESALVAILFRRAAQLAPLTDWWINRYDPATQSSITTHWTPGIEAYGTQEEIRRPVSIHASPMIEGLHLHRKSVHIPSCEAGSEFPDQDLWPIRTFVGLPLVHEGRVVGTLCGGSFGNQGHVRILEEQIKALESLGEAAGLVLDGLHARQALEEEEARFRLLFERSPDPIVLISDETILDVNTAAAQLFGMDRGRMADLHVLVLNPEWQPDGRLSVEGFRDQLQKALAGKQDPFEWTFLCSDGREVVCQVNLTRLDHGDQPIIHAIVRDLTAQRQAEAERTTLERQLFQAQKMESLGVLAGGIAHDFNNLLMGVLGHAGLALEQLNPLHPARRNLEAIQNAGQRAADLTRQMLAYSGRGQFVVRNLDLSLQIEEMLHLLKVSLPKTVVLNLDLQRKLPAISADASQVQQVIMNLVINAAEAIGEASGAITLATGAQRLDKGGLRKMLVGQDAHPGTYVYLEVTDTGCGMDPETMSRIFEPFFTTKFTGRGLGLSAIMGIVRGHKGALRVYSEVGNGTTFKVLFPACAPVEEAEADHAPETPWTGSGLVLVVDDDETVRAVARQALEWKGFQVLEARDGLAAVELVRHRGGEIRLVLLDMTMPHMGGDAAFREMRRACPDIRVILSSGYSEVEAMGRFLGKGLKGFVQKPYGPRDLLAKIHQVLEG